MDKLKQQGTKAFIWDFLGKFAFTGMAFFISLILARLLEPSDFGLVAIVIAIIVIAGIFSDGGLSKALIQRRKVLPIHYASVFYFNVIIAFILTFCLFVSAPYIANFYNNDVLVHLIHVISFTFIIGSLSTVQRAKLQKELNYALLTKLGLFAVFSGGIIGIVFALNGAGVWSLVALEMIQGIVYTISIWLLSKWKPIFKFSIKALQQLWKFGFAMLLSDFLIRVFSQLDAITIGKLFAPATLGFYNRAKALDQMVINYSSGSLNTILFPVLSKVQNNLDRFQNIIIKSLGVITFIVFMLLGGLFLVSDELIMILYGEKWLQSAEYFKILILGGFSYPIKALLNNILISRGNSKDFLKQEIITKIILVFSFFIMYQWGMYAFLYSLVLVAFINIIISIMYASHEIKLPFMMFLRPILIQMGIMVISIFLTILFVDNLESIYFLMLIIKGTIFTIIYFSINYLVQSSSYNYFLEQILPLIKNKFNNTSCGK